MHGENKYHIRRFRTRRIAADGQTALPVNKGEQLMVKVALLVRLEAKPGKETAVAQFLEGALPLANQENYYSRMVRLPIWAVHVRDFERVSR